MTRLETHIIDVLENAPTNRATMIHLVDEIDLRAGEFTMAEFDDALDSLREAGAIRIRNPSAPEHEIVVQYLGGGPEVGSNG
jgi:hypothetical protein